MTIQFKGDVDSNAQWKLNDYLFNNDVRVKGIEITGSGVCTTCEEDIITIQID